MTQLIVEVPDTLTAELAYYGISDEQISQIVVQVMEMWLRTGKETLSLALISRWLEALEDQEDIRDVAETERLWEEDPDAFMSLEEFNAACDNGWGQ